MLPSRTMTTNRHVAKGPRLSVTETLRELGLSKAKASALAREAERLVDEVLPPRESKPATKRHSTALNGKGKAKPRARAAVSRAA